MAAEQKPKRPLVVWAIGLVHCGVALRLLHLAWRAAPVVRPGADIRALCGNVGPLLQSVDALGCTRAPVESVKLDLLVSGTASLVLATFMLATAGGMLCLRKWARNWSINIWGMILAVGSHDYVHPPHGHLGFRPGCVYFVVGLTVILALLYSTGVPESFGESQ